MYSIKKNVLFSHLAEIFTIAHKINFIVRDTHHIYHVVLEIIFENTSDTIFLKHFYESPFRGDPMTEEIREAKVAKVIRKMGDKYVLAKPIKRIDN